MCDSNARYTLCITLLLCGCCWLHIHHVLQRWWWHSPQAKYGSATHTLGRSRVQQRRHHLHDLAVDSTTADEGSGIPYAIARAASLTAILLALLLAPPPPIRIQPYAHTQTPTHTHTHCSAVLCSAQHQVQQAADQLSPLSDLAWKATCSSINVAMKK